MLIIYDAVSSVIHVETRLRDYGAVYTVPKRPVKLMGRLYDKWDDPSPGSG